MKRRLPNNAGGLYAPRDDPDADNDPFRPFTPDEYAAQLDGLRIFEQHPEVRCIWEFQPTKALFRV